MAMRKYGTSKDQKVLPETSDDPKTAKKNWSDEDEKALHEENKKADRP